MSSYFIWTPEITEARLLDDAVLLQAFVRLVEMLLERGTPVAHLHARYLVFALRDLGMAAVVHHLGWVDRGEPAHQTGSGPRSCQTYVGLHRQQRSREASQGATRGGHRLGNPVGPLSCSRGCPIFAPTYPFRVAVASISVDPSGVN